MKMIVHFFRRINKSTNLLLPDWTGPDWCAEYELLVCGSISPWRKSAEL